MTKIMGIINITPDSFSDKHLNNGEIISHEFFLDQFENMVKAGAHIIDIGAESTRPNATPLSDEQEWSRLKPYIEILAAQKKLMGKLPVEISIDSYHPKTIENCLKLGVIDYINDVSGLNNKQMIEVAKKSNLKVIFMHSLTVPADKNIMISSDDDEIKILNNFAKKKISELEKAGIAKDKIIFDVGLGFGKSTKQSYNIVKNIDKFKKLGVELLVGHSEKSFLSLFTNKQAGERWLETAIFSSFLASKNINYIRVHDVELNARAIKLKDIFL
jgi:dihydropteroate synthase